MEKQTITFKADEQSLVKTGGTNCYASNIVSYIEAHFDLGANWSGYDSVRAVWSNDNNMSVISTVLDADGICVVPFEVLKTMGVVKVNLVGSISVSDTLTDRLTTFPCEALTVARKAKINGSETTPITPSQFEQFIAVVISEVEKVTGMTAEAETLPAGSQATARYEDGVLYLGIPQGIQGIQGEAGADGADGNGIAQVLYNSDYSITFVFTNGERFTTPSLRGETGATGLPGPAGQDGRDGTDGRDGIDGTNGVTPSLSVGTVTTLPSTEDAYVTRTGTDENPVFNFGIPQGPQGEQGEVSYEDLSSLLPTDTASGAIASFPDGQSVIPAVAVKAEIEPIQSGSGTPSPDNVRPISGHTECVTSISPTTSASDATTHTTSLGRTVYGGEVDVVSGVLTVDSGKAVLDGSESWTAYPSYNGFYTDAVNMKRGVRQDGISNMLVNSKNGDAGQTNAMWLGVNSTRLFVIGVYDSMGSTVEDFKSYLSQHNLEVTYPLDTPQTYQLTPTEIELLQGQNNVWCDTGEVEVTYKADVGLYINKKLNV